MCPYCSPRKVSVLMDFPRIKVKVGDVATVIHETGTSPCRVLLVKFSSGEQLAVFEFWVKDVDARVV